eukprot:GEMP01005810.1.p1 GENE.GEMP01005810.1~~GEMP01005810.1.p1  ORF type:complete len:593 (+),score=130.58 GEMP01005810.1:67-1845(+)
MLWPSQSHDESPTKLDIPNPAATNSWKRNAVLLFSEDFDRMWRIITMAFPQGHWYDISEQDFLEYKRISQNTHARFLCTPDKETLIRRREQMLIVLATSFALVKRDLQCTISRGYASEAEYMRIVDDCAEDFKNLMPDAYRPFWLGLVRLPYFKIQAQELFLMPNPGFNYLCTGAMLYKEECPQVFACMRECVEEGISDQLLIKRLDALRKKLDGRNACHETIAFRSNFGVFLGKREHLWLDACNHARLKTEMENTITPSQELLRTNRIPRDVNADRASCSSRRPSPSPSPPTTKIRKEDVSAERASGSSRRPSPSPPATKRRKAIPVIDIDSTPEDSAPSIPNGQVSRMTDTQSSTDSPQIRDLAAELVKNTASPSGNGEYAPPNALPNGILSPSTTSNEDLDASMCTPLPLLRSVSRSTTDEALHNGMNEHTNAETTDHGVNNEGAQADRKKNVEGAERSTNDPKAPKPSSDTIDRSQQCTMEDFSKGHQKVINSGAGVGSSTDRAVGSSYVVVEDSPSASQFDPHQSNEAINTIKCPICVTHSDELHVSTKCGHGFCKACWENWFRDHETCPICRVKTRMNNLILFRIQ